MRGKEFQALVNVSVDPAVVKELIAKYDNPEHRFSEQALKKLKDVLTVDGEIKPKIKDIIPHVFVGDRFAPLSPDKTSARPEGLVASGTVSDVKPTVR
jgi:hypothetical protein